ncbi:T6SS immunity protein Tli4 family protein [Cupriavidus taiwanensis]|uniref:T6SS immunity protein Tli4 family protein n=1 Tax=Cupriavidus taiwanensis TaxID=164546 RepID=UPI000472C4BA|nr:T6SS immunity protein Tli4 family protein [Cupriavidus taiwanensis]
MIHRLTKYRCLVAVALILASPASMVDAQAVASRPSLNKEDWKTHCFGRYLIDLPPQAVIRTTNKIWGNEISPIPGLTPGTLRSMIDQREKELRATHHETQGSMFVSRTMVGDGSEVLLSWSLPYSKAMLSGNTYLVSKDPWRAFKYGGDVSPGREPIALRHSRTLAANIRSRADNEIPTGPGFCIDQGFIAGNDYRSESVQVGITLPQHPNAFISFDASTGAEEDRLLERVDNFLAKAVAGPLAGLKVLRKRERNVGTIPAEEYATAATGNGQRVYVFAWESQGKNKSLSEQNVSAGLRVLEQPVDSPQTPYQPAFQSDDEALQLWDAIIDSIRLRPGAV